MKQTQAFLLAKKMVAEDVCHLYFYVAGDGFEFIPGQYAILTVPTSPTPLKRLYSFAGGNQNKNVFELLIKLIPGGAASEYVRSLKVGDAITASGPAGLFRQQNTPKRKIYMVTGTGYAPVRSFITSGTNSPNGVLFWGVKDYSDVYLLEELINLAKAHSSFSFFYCLSQTSSFDSIPAELLHYFRSGHIDAVLNSQIPSIDPNDEYYLCGSRTVIESIRTLLLSKGVQKENLFFEKY